MKIIKSNEFKNEIKIGIVVVDFFATWCGPCKMLGPVLESLSTEMEGEVKFVKLDVDECSDIANEYGISSVPTMIIFKDNQKVDMLVGFLPKERIEQVIKSHL